MYRIFPGEQFDAMYGEFFKGNLEDTPIPPREQRVKTPDPRYVYVKRPMISVRFYGFNTQVKPLDDRRVRQALVYAVDREAIIEEVFLLDGKDVLQLTNFRRSDTARAGRGGALAGQRVFFEASANPLRTNPGENCQVFSIDIRGGDLRQLTRLRDRGHPSGVGCFTANPASCSIERISAISLQAPSPSRRAAIPSGGTHPGIRPSACAPTARDCAS